MSNSIDEALLLTANHFKGVQDKGGQPYILHCLRVMMNFTDPTSQQVGLMHDLVEDTPVTLEQLREQGFAPDVVEALDLLTHRSEVSYADYVRRLKSNPVARKVKMADLRDNASLTRVAFRAEHSGEDLARIRKYVISYQFLDDQISEDQYLRLMSS
jgi:(p)ppGpp synthase/HD superfamily hydrolase